MVYVGRERQNEGEFRADKKTNKTRVHPNFTHSPQKYILAHTAFCIVIESRSVSQDLISQLDSVCIYACLRRICFSLWNLLTSSFCPYCSEISCQWNLAWTEFHLIFWEFSRPHYGNECSSEFLNCFFEDFLPCVPCSVWNSRNSHPRLRL